MEIRILAVFAMLFVWSCAPGEFMGSGGNFAKNSSNGNCKPTPQKPCVTAGGPSTGTPEANSSLESTDGGRALISRSYSNFYFSGNGPGSCANDPNCGTGAPACEAGSVDAEVGIIGDCIQTRAGACYGNRKICKSIGKISDDFVVTDFHLYVDRACPDGWEGAGPVPGQNHHIFNYYLPENREKPWGYYAFCKLKTPSSQVVRNFTHVVTDIRLDNAGSRTTSPAACPSGYVEAGVITDCVNAPGITKDNSACSGQVRVCKKFELVP